MEVSCSWVSGGDQEAIITLTVKRMGYSTLKERQKQAIFSFVNGRDVFVVLPTGFGKSLCYGCLPLVFDTLRKHEGSVVIVVSPLVALMKDQVDFFSSKGLTAVKADGCCKESYRDIVGGKYQLVFISPEAILSHQKWRRLLLLEVYQRNLVALVIDEAHCMRNWCVTCP